jgi:glycosyltransferase involved in cell wall biosynthesis
LARADVFALLSTYESQGLAVLEALALSTPVVVSDLPAFSQLAADDAISRVPTTAGTDLIAAALRSAAHIRVQSLPLPTWNDCASQLATLYDRILREGSHS